jgi:hypothetical protein
MWKKALFLAIAIALIMPPISHADIVCEEGHVFVYNGVWHCNPGAGYNGCLRCYDTITVGGGCADPNGCVENPEP